jgi:hypothetical protein
MLFLHPGGLAVDMLKRVNKTVVSVDDMIEALEVVHGIAPEDRSVMEVRYIRLLDHFTGGNRKKALEVGPKVKAIEFRFEALSRLHAEGHPELKAWSIPAGADGAVLESKELLKVAATEPLIERAGQLAFDEERFFQRVLEISEEEGRA